MGDLALVFVAAVLAGDQVQGVTEPADLDQSHADGKEQAGAKQYQQRQRIAPQQARECAGPVGQLAEKFHRRLTGFAGS